MARTQLGIGAVALAGVGAVAVGAGDAPRWLLAPSLLLAAGGSLAVDERTEVSG